MKKINLVVEFMVNGKVDYAVLFKAVLTKKFIYGKSTSLSNPVYIRVKRKHTVDDTSHWIADPGEIIYSMEVSTKRGLKDPKIKINPKILDEISNILF